MTEQAAHRHAEGLAHGMGITFYVVRTREGDFLPVQQPSEDCKIIAAVEPPDSAPDGRQFDRGIAGATRRLPSPFRKIF